MRIVHTCLRYPPATGGAEEYVRGIVEHTRDIEAGRDVRVLSSGLRTHGPISLLQPEDLLGDPPYLQRIHVSRTPLLSYPRLQALSYYLAHHKPDIIHGHSFWYQPADVAAKYATKAKIPFILHPIYYENDIRRKLSWQLYKKTVGRATFAAADVVAVISPFEQTLIEQAGFPVKRFELIPPGIDTARLNVPAENPYLKRSIPGQILLAVGRLASSKALDELIAVMPDILRRQSDVHLCIVGEDFGAQESLIAQVASLNLQQHIHFLGKLSDNELVGAYQHADIFVHPSHYEAFGIVVAEALAAGTPVVARNTAAIPFVAPHRQAALLFTTPAELTSAILELLQSKTLQENLGSYGQQYVQEHFNWPVVIKKLAGLYQELVKPTS